MAHWLLKGDPESYGYDDLEKEKKTVWDGVANFTALRNIGSMKKGDEAFIYHSGKEKSIVARARVVSNPYPDPKKKDPRLVVVELEAKGRLKHPVSLSAIKARSTFSDFPLVRIPRLSVMPVTDKQWSALIEMSQQSSEK